MYRIPVKLEGIERRKRSTGLLHIVAGFFLIANAGSYNKLLNYEKIPLVLPFYLIALVCIIYGFFRRRIDPSARYNHWIRLTEFLSFAVIGILMIRHTGPIGIIGIFLWAVVILFLMFTERKIFHDTDLQIKKEGIFVPGYFSSHIIPWNMVSHFVLRPDYLTITRSNGKYVQLELIKEISPNLIAEINHFSMEQIQQQAQGLKTINQP